MNWAQFGQAFLTGALAGILLRLGLAAGRRYRRRWIEAGRLVDRLASEYAEQPQLSDEAVAMIGVLESAPPSMDALAAGMILADLLRGDAAGTPDVVLAAVLLQVSALARNLEMSAIEDGAPDFSAAHCRLMGVIDGTILELTALDRETAA